LAQRFEAAYGFQMVAIEEVKSLLEVCELSMGKGGMGIVIFWKGEDFGLGFVLHEDAFAAMSLDGFGDKEEVFVREEGVDIIEVGLKGCFGAAAVVTQVLACLACCCMLDQLYIDRFEELVDDKADKG
jgi:hypothetical protein